MLEQRNGGFLGLFLGHVSRAMTGCPLRAGAVPSIMWSVAMMAVALALTATAKVPPQLPLPSSCNPLVCACAEDLGAANCTGKVSIHQYEDLRIHSRA